MTRLKLGFSLTRNLLEFMNKFQAGGRKNFLTLDSKGCLNEYVACKFLKHHF